MRKADGFQQLCHRLELPILYSYFCPLNRFVFLAYVRKVLRQCFRNARCKTQCVGRPKASIPTQNQSRRKRTPTIVNAIEVQRD